nr:vacuolar cation/proton exchanger 2 [Quercus suber]
MTTAVVNSGLLTEVYFRKSKLALSRFSSCIMLVTYAAYLFFQLKNQRNLNVPFNKRASIALNMPVSFISFILLPLVGNAVDHASAITYSMKDKLIPFSVVLGWIMGQPLDLNFQLFETATLFISIFVVALMLQEGTHYFKGLMLLLCYLIVAASFFCTC